MKQFLFKWASRKKSNVVNDLELQRQVEISARESQVAKQLMLKVKGAVAERDAKLDLEVARASNDLVQELEAEIRLADILLLNKDISAAKRVYADALDLAQKLDYKDNIAYCLLRIGICLNLDGEFESALEMYGKAQSYTRNPDIISTISYFKKNYHNVIDILARLTNTEMPAEAKTTIKYNDVILYFMILLFSLATIIIVVKLVFN